MLPVRPVRGQLGWCWVYNLLRARTLLVARAGWKLGCQRLPFRRHGAPMEPVGDNREGAIAGVIVP